MGMVLEGNSYYLRATKWGTIIAALGNFPTLLGNFVTLGNSAVVVDNFAITIDNFVTSVGNFVVTFCRNKFSCASPDFPEGCPQHWVKH
jgi:hypothetical protein